MRIRETHTVPVWDDDGRVHIAGINEVRPDLEDHVVGWANLAVIELGYDLRTFLLIYPTKDVT